MIITAAAGAEAKKPTEGDGVKTTMQTSRGWRRRSTPAAMR